MEFSNLENISNVLLKFYSIYMSIFLGWISVQCMCSYCAQKPGEEGVGFSGSAVMDSLGPQYTTWKLNLPSQKGQPLLDASSEHMIMGQWNHSYSEHSKNKSYSQGLERCWIKVLVARYDNLSLICSVHMLEGKNWLKTSLGVCGICTITSLLKLLITQI